MKFLVKSEKIRLVAKLRDVALCSYQLNSESKTLGNYICMDKTKSIKMSTTPNYTSYNNTTTTLPMRNVTATNNDSVSYDVIRNKAFNI